MKTSDRRATTRRAALRGAGRWLGLGALAAVGGGALFASRPREGECAFAVACRQCPAFERCRLPAARAAKRERS